jgi:hypothetical protein
MVEGLSEKMRTAQIMVRTGWRRMMVAVSTAGSRGRAYPMRSHPAT